LRLLLLLLYPCEPGLLAIIIITTTINTAESNTNQPYSQTELDFSIFLYAP
jgi:hypothetical protein